MAEYRLYCFAESGNAYKAALTLELCGLEWQARKVDFFGGETRTPEYRQAVNEMGEVPVLEHGDRRLTQSGVILDYLSQQAGRFRGESDDERREIWRWILFDNHKLTSYLGTLRFLLRFAKTGETPVTEFLRGRVQGALQIVEGHLAGREYMVGGRATIADLSMCGYLYFGDELGLDLTVYPHLQSWLGRIAALPGWKHSYDLMPRAFGG
jgi:glutathione S-transferase